jgi:hypothetical protein
MTWSSTIRISWAGAFSYTVRSDGFSRGAVPGRTPPSGRASPPGTVRHQTVARNRNQCRRHIAPRSWHPAHGVAAIPAFRSAWLTPTKRLDCSVHRMRRSTNFIIHSWLPSVSLVCQAHRNAGLMLSKNPLISASSIQFSARFSIPTASASNASCCPRPRRFVGVSQS